MFNKVGLLLITYIEVDFRPFMSILPVYLLYKILEKWLLCFDSEVDMHSLSLGNRASLRILRRPYLVETLVSYNP